MKISVTLEHKNDTISVIIDEKMRIADAVEKLHVLGYLQDGGGEFMRSSVQERVVSTRNSFREENIKSGDKITTV